MSVWLCGAIGCPGHSRPEHRCDSGKHPGRYWYCGRVRPPCPGHSSPEHKCQKGELWTCGAVQCPTHGGRDHICRSGVWFCGRKQQPCPGHPSREQKCDPNAALLLFPIRRLVDRASGISEQIRGDVRKIMAEFYNQLHTVKWGEARKETEEQALRFIRGLIRTNWRRRSDSVNNNLRIVGIRLHDISSHERSQRRYLRGTRTLDYFALINGSWDNDNNVRVAVYQGYTHPIQLNSDEAPDVNKDKKGDVAWLIPGVYVLKKKRRSVTVLRRGNDGQLYKVGKAKIRITAYEVSGFFVGNTLINDAWGRGIPIWRDTDQSGCITRDEARRIYIGNKYGAKYIQIHLAGYSIGCNIIVGKDDYNRFIGNIGGVDKIPYILVDVNRRYHTLDHLQTTLGSSGYPQEISIDNFNSAFTQNWTELNIVDRY